MPKKDYSTEDVKKKLNTFKWDFPAEAPIPYFDRTKSYELTGYRPITDTEGLDFDPKWFTEIVQNKVRTKRYTNAIPGSRSFKQFWDNEFEKCQNSVTINNYTITGDHYFFLNYYPIMAPITSKNGEVKRVSGFPTFIDVQYEFFHYLKMCRLLGKDALALKSRGIGFSHLAAALGVNMYTTRPDTKSLYTAFSEDSLISEGVLTKAWECLDYLNDDTEGAMRHIRQAKNTVLHKRASMVDKAGEELVNSWKSEIIGRVVDNPRKLRGARTEWVFFEEGGSYKDLTRAYRTAEALVEIQGEKFGTRVVWGTGGDEGVYVEGIEKMYYDPGAFNILPFYNNFNSANEWVKTGYFVPAYRMLIRYMDNRGVTNWEKAKTHYYNERKKVETKPKEYLELIAEYCFTPEEALSKRAGNDFDKEKLAAQKVEILMHQTTRRVRCGRLEWIYGQKQKIEGVQFIEDIVGPIKITEEPVLEDGNRIDDLYIGGIDSIDQGEDNSVVGEDGSNFAILIKKRAYGMDGERYVASYVERPSDERIAYENALKLLYYFNAKANLEDTRRTIVTHFRDRGQLWRLATRPRSALGNPDLINGKATTLIGTPGSTKMRQHGLNLVGHYILDNYYKIDFLDLIDELLNYSDVYKTKYDRVAAMLMCEIYDEDLTNVLPQSRESYDKTWQDIGYFINENGVRVHGVLPKPQLVANPPQGPIRFLDLQNNQVIYD